jgi:Leucine-rich repeat (LRR) protein
MKFWSSLLIGWCLSSGAFLLKAETATFTHDIMPVLEKNCTSCHGLKKQKAGLRLDTYSLILKGSENGAIINLGNAQDSELYRRINLNPNDNDFMPTGGKPPLKPDEIELIKQWIIAKNPETGTFTFSKPHPPAVIVEKAAPDYRPKLREALALAEKLRIKLVPRSLIPTDGLILRTASNPKRCTDETLAQLAPYSDLIVEAELPRTLITDKGLSYLRHFKNLQVLDIAFTRVTNQSIGPLLELKALKKLNVSGTHITEPALKRLAHLDHVWTFNEPAATLIKTNKS